MTAVADRSRAMAQGWKTIRVFLSSTFRDMHAERDYLVRFVFPRLREELLARRLHLVDVDLRWGVTSDQDALQFCREVIDECRPRFLCFLGGRYGWVPPGQRRSITADEVYHAALDQRQQRQHSCFLFRDPASTAAIPEADARAGGYREFPQSEEVDQLGLTQAEALAARRAADLEALKQAIAAAGLPTYVYPARWDDAAKRLIGLDAFGERVRSFLLDSVADEFGAASAQVLDEFAEEDAATEVFISERVEGFVAGSREPLLEALGRFAVTDTGPDVLLVTGGPGSGKSALLGQFVRQHTARYPQALVLPHFVGASPGSTDLRRTLRRLCRGLAQASHFQEAMPEEVEALTQHFAALLTHAAAGRDVVVVLDAINQMDAAHHAHRLGWLPDPLPARVRVVVSSPSHAVTAALRGRHGGLHELELPPLPPADARAIVAGYLARYHKRMSSEQIDVLLTKPDGGTPLYLLVALEELRTLGTYEEITDRIRQLPGEVRALFVWILRDRLANDPGFRDQAGESVGAWLVRRLLSCLAASRHGLSQGELVGLVEPGDPLGNVAALLRLLRPYLMRRGELLDFHHAQFREAVADEYLHAEQDCLAAQHTLVAFFTQQGLGNRRTLSELPYHLTQAREWRTLEEVLCDLEFLEAKFRAGLGYDVAADYDRLGVTRTLPGAPVVTVRVHEGRHGVFCPHCLAWTAIDPGQLARQVDCPSCRRPLKLNPFALAAAWRPAGALRRRPEEGAGTIAELSPAVAEFADFVKEQTPVLSQRPNLTFQQAANEPDRTAPARTARQRHQSGQEKRPWLARLNKPQRRSACLMTLIGHHGWVRACAISPDGTLFASAGQDRKLKLWDAATGVELASIDAHVAPVRACCFSPDGTRLATAATDGTLKLWDAAAGTELAAFAAHTEKAKGVEQLAFSPDGSRLVSSSDGSVTKLWDTATGRALIVLEGRRAVFSPDGTRIVTVCRGGTGGERHGQLHVWEAAKGTKLATFPGIGSDILACDFAPDGSRVAAATDDGILRLLDPASGAELAQLLGHWTLLFACRFSPDGSRLVTGGYDGSVVLWDAIAGTSLCTFAGHGAEDSASPLKHAGQVHACVFSPDGARVLSASDDGTLKLWDAVADVADAGTRHDLAVNACAFAPDGQRFASAGADHTLRLWDGHTGVSLMNLTGHTQAVHACAYSVDGCRIVSGADDETVRVWDAGTGEEVLTLHAGSAVHCCVFSPDGTRLLWGTSQHAQTGVVALWDLSSQTERARLRLSMTGINACAFFPNGTRVVYATNWGMLCLCDASTLDVQTRLGGMGRSILACGLSPDGAYLAAQKEQLTIWDAQTGEVRTTLPGHTGCVRACAFSPVGPHLMTACDDGTLLVWDLRAANEMCTFVAGRALRTAAWAPDGRRLVAGDDLGQLFLLRLENLPDQSGE